jgi:hypothetical protein
MDLRLSSLHSDPGAVAEPEEIAECDIVHWSDWGVSLRHGLKGYYLER